MIELVPLDMSWIDGSADDPDDLCAHGRVRLRVGEVVLVDAGDGGITVSCAAHSMLRTLENEHTPQAPLAGGNPMFPGCAFNAWPAADGETLERMGCPRGLDVWVEHLPGSRVRLSRDGRVAELDWAEWAAAVVAFARRVEAFYAASSPKVPCEDELERQGWARFWDEWRSLMERHAGGSAATGAADAARPG